MLRVAADAYGWTGPGLVDAMLTIVRNFRSLGFTGEVACVNPKYQDILGYPCYPALEAVPFVPDTVLVAVARERVIGVLEQTARKRARGAVVFAIGFGEADELGRGLETRLRDLARDAQMAVIACDVEPQSRTLAYRPIFRRT